MPRKVLAGFLIIAVSLGFRATAQQYAFQITFTDKNNTPYSLSAPSAYLSARSLQRRANQGIVVDSTDLPVNPAYVDSVLALTGGKLHGTSRWLNMCMVLVASADSAQILNLSGKPFISNIKLVGYYDPDLQRLAHTTGGNGQSINPNTQKKTTADESYYMDTWAQTALVNGNYLLDNGYKGQNMLIAVLDAGFIGTDTHPGFDSMWQTGRMVDTFNFVYDNTGVFSQDDHGTEVLSTMAGYVPGTFVGSAPLAGYALYVTEYDPNDQPLELDNMICAAERADSIGADVITESLGYDLFLNPADGQNFFTDLDGKTTVAAKAANIATKKGILFVATAGNDGTPVPGWGNHILTPGDADSALTIGAVDNTGTPAGFSGYGPNAIGRIKPDVSGMGVSTAIFNSSGGYITGDGTSFSTPQIAGWAACLWQTDRNATPYQIRQAIITCASQYTTPGDQIGYGIPNFECTEETLDINDPVLDFTLAHWVFATPNPFDNELKLSVSPDTNGIIRFRVCDMSGKEVIALEQYFYKGYNTPVTLSLAPLPAGMYVLNAVSATQSQVVKLEKY